MCHPLGVIHQTAPEYGRSPFRSPLPTVPERPRRQGPRIGSPRAERPEAGTGGTGRPAGVELTPVDTYRRPSGGVPSATAGNRSRNPGWAGRAHRARRPAPASGPRRRLGRGPGRHADLSRVPARGRAGVSAAAQLVHARGKATVKGRSATVVTAGSGPACRRRAAQAEPWRPTGRPSPPRLRRTGLHPFKKSGGRPDDIHLGWSPSVPETIP